MEEVWRPVVGLEGRYEVSNLGRVKTLHHMNSSRVQIMKTEFNGEDYERVEFRVDGVRHKYAVHRLVAEAFVPNPESKPCVDHIDGNRRNNHACNLRWCTHQENMNYPGVRKTMSDQRMGNKNHMFGKKMPKESCEKMSIAHKKLVGAKHPGSIPVAQYSLDGTFMRQWSCASDASSSTGINRGAIQNCCRGTAKSSGGYIWHYVRK